MIIPKPKQFAERGELKVACTILADAELSFGLKAFGRIFKKIYGVTLADLARKWHGFDVLLGYVDLCYLNKIKYLQLHFVDDRGWTMPLRTFPAAATKGPATPMRRSLISWSMRTKRQSSSFPSVSAWVIPVS